MLENNSVSLSEFNTNSSSQDEETKEVCIANISPLERQKRLSEEKIEDNAELAQVRRQARRVIFRAFLVAFLLTWIVFLLPL